MPFEDAERPAAPEASLVSETPLAPSNTVAPLHVQKRGVFMGRFGLRAGWGILIYIVLATVFIILASVGTLAATGKLKEAIAKAQAHRTANATHATTPAPPPPVASQGMHPRGTFINESLTFGGLLLTCFLMTKIERRRFGVYGIGKNRALDLLPGAFWGLASLSLLVFVLHARHLLVFDGRALFGSAAILYGVKWLAVFFFVGCFEEYLFRGYIQHALTRGFFGLGERISALNARVIAFFFASIITSWIFYKAHTGNAGETGWGLFAVFLAGVVFTYALWRTGSLWWGIGFHMAWDWAQSFLYGVPDSGNLSYGRLFNTHALGDPRLSGGSDGPEGSLFVIPTLLIVLVIIRFTRPGIQPSLETEAIDTAPTEPHTALA